MRLCFLMPAALLVGTSLGQTPDVVIRSSAREVLLDVVVRDAHGRLITNLKPGEVTVYEDGIRQEVRSFRLVAGSEVRIEDRKQAAEAQAAETHISASNATHPPLNPLRTVNAVCLILNDLNPETRTFAFGSARQFVDQELRPNTFIGVFSLDASGLRPVYPFSNDRGRLLKAVGLAAVNQLPSINLSSSAMFDGLSMSAVGSALPGVSAVEFADGSSVKDPLGMRGDMGLAANAGLREIDALIGLVRQLSPLPFQKTVLLLGTGLTRPPDQLEYWDSLIHAATTGGVTFYAMDVYGLGVCQGDTDPDCVAHSAMAQSAVMLPYIAGMSKQQGPASVGAGGNIQPPAASANPAAASAAVQAPPPATSTAQAMEMAHQDDYLKFMVASANRQEAIRELAERTGGFLIANTNNTDKLLAQVMEEVDTHYEIAYPPTSERFDGRFRKIEVKLARPGLQAATRGGYFAVPDTGADPVTPGEMAGLKALDTALRPHAFEFLSRAYRFRESGGTAQYAIAFELPISTLTAAPTEAANKYRLHASLLALVKDTQGQIVVRVSKDISSEVSGDQLAAVQAERITYERAVSLPAGQYTVEAAVVDHEGHRASTSVVQVDNRERRESGLSDLALVRRLENLSRPPDAADPFEFTGKRVLPLVSTDLAAGAQPFVYFVVYPRPGNAAKADVRVQLLRNGQVVSTRAPALPPPDASGAIPVVIEEANDPGRYEVKATVVEGDVSTERSIAYTLAGNARAPSLVTEIPKPSPPANDGANRAAGLSSNEGQLARFKEKVRQDFTGIPNYTCLETIARARRAPPLTDFLPLDTVRLEVSSVAGKEMFARPGARSFDNQDVTSLVPDGLIGSGMFASLARNLFVKDKGTLRYKGKENQDGHVSVRYSFRLTRQESGFKVQVYDKLEPLAFKGSFWFDPVSLDLVRVEAHADALPVDLNVEESLIRTSYTRTQIGNSDALLPKLSELSVTYLSGVTNRDVIEFSRCHEYRSESTIRFDAPPPPPPPPPEVPKP